MIEIHLISIDYDLWDVIKEGYIPPKGENGIPKLTRRQNQLW